MHACIRYVDMCMLQKAAHVSKQVSRTRAALRHGMPTRIYDLYTCTATGGVWLATATTLCCFRAQPRNYRVTQNSVRGTHMHKSYKSRADISDSGSRGLQAAQQMRWAWSHLVHPRASGAARCAHSLPGGGWGMRPRSGEGGGCGVRPGRPGGGWGGL